MVKTIIDYVIIVAYISIKKAMRIIITFVFATIFSALTFAQSNVNKPEIEFKIVKTVGDKLNVYFDIIGITDTTQISGIKDALENYSEVYKCNIYTSSYNSYRCLLITTPEIDAVTVNEILQEQGVNYDSRTVRINNKEKNIK